MNLKAESKMIHVARAGDLLLTSLHHPERHEFYGQVSHPTRFEQNDIRICTRSQYYSIMVKPEGLKTR